MQCKLGRHVVRRTVFSSNTISYNVFAFCAATPKCARDFSSDPTISSRQRGDRVKTERRWTVFFDASNH